MARDGDVMGQEAISGRGIKEEMNGSQEMLPPLLILVIRCCSVILLEGWWGVP